MPDITTIRGDTRVVAAPVFDDELDRFRTEGELDLIDTINYKVSDSPEDGTTHIEKSDTDAAVSVVSVSDINSVAFDDLDSTVGIIRIKLEPTDTEGLPAETLWHEIQIVDDESNTVTVVRGDFDVLESSTNP
jgi:hypothetical protein